MARTVRVKVTSSDQIKTMDEGAAQRLVKINPKEYRILEAPKVDVINLPKLEPTVDTEKKSVLVAEAENKEPETIKRPPGRPKVNP